MNEFEKYLEANRKAFIKLTEQQERELARLYIEAAGEIKERAELIIDKKGLSYAAAKIRIKSLLREASRLTDNFSKFLDKALLEAADLKVEADRLILESVQQELKSEGVKLKLTRILNKIPPEAVKYTFNKIWEDGLKLSDRVWLLDKVTKQEIERIVMQNIMVGGSASDNVTIAALENLLNPNYKKAKLTSLHGKRVGYEASRLLRTETNVSAREAQRLASLRNPASKGFVWRASGECCDICESLNGEQFKADEIPHNPHPNCRCWLEEVVEDVDSFTDRYLEFMDNPKSQPDIDNWYRNVYKKSA